jgi:DNA-binding IclR family transcriptional regulator
LAKGRSVAQISETLKLSSSTVGTHLYHLKQKLGLVNQAEMTLIAVRHGLIDVGIRWVVAFLHRLKVDCEIGFLNAAWL